MNVLFPSNYFNINLPDEVFKEQYVAFKEESFVCHVANLDEFSFTKIKPPIENCSALLYRGYMLTPQEYENIYRKLQGQNITLISTPDDYQFCHYIPNWYNEISELTPKTLIFNSIDEATIEISKLNWDGFIIKDFVKSLNTSMGPLITNSSDFPKLIEEMTKFRGKIEGGVCIRKFEKWKTDSESRAFVLHGQVFLSDDNEPPEILLKVSEKIKRPFYSIDYIKDSTGIYRIVEIGDGQVSDLKNWTSENFVKIFKHVG